MSSPRSSSPFLLVVAEQSDDDGSTTQGGGGAAATTTSHTCKLDRSADSESEEDLAKLKKARDELDSILSRRQELLAQSSSSASSDPQATLGHDIQLRISSLRQELASLQQQLRNLEETSSPSSSSFFPHSDTAAAAASQHLPHPACDVVLPTPEECDIWFQQKLSQAEQFAVTSRVAEEVPDYDPSGDPIVEECFTCRISFEPLEDPHHLFGMTFSGGPLKQWVTVNKKHPILNRPASLDDIFPDIAIRDAMERHVQREKQIVMLKRREAQRAIVQAKIMRVKANSLGEEVRRQMEVHLAAEAEARRAREHKLRQSVQETLARHAKVAELSKKILSVQANLQREELTAVTQCSAASADLSMRLAQLAADEEAKRREVQLIADAISNRRRAALERKRLWEPDKPNCSLCAHPFSLLVQRGRCHRCGLNVCYSCSQNVGRLHQRECNDATSDAAVPICQKCFAICHRELKLREMPHLREDRSTRSLASVESCGELLEDGHPLFDVAIAGSSSFLSGDFDFARAAAIRSARALVDASPQGGIGIAVDFLTDVVAPSVVGYVTAACDYCKSLLPPPQTTRTLR